MGNMATQPNENFKAFVEKSFLRGGVTASTGNPEEYLFVRMNSSTAMAFDRLKEEVWNVHVSALGVVLMCHERDF